MELISVIKRFQKRIVHFENRDEVEITADIQDAIAGSLNSKYDLHISREFTMGEPLKNWVRQICIYTQRRTDMLQIMQCLRINISKTLQINITS